MTIIKEIEELLESNDGFQKLFWTPGAAFCGSNKYGFHLSHPQTTEVFRIGSKNRFEQEGKEANLFRQQKLDERDSSREAYREVLRPFTEVQGSSGQYVRLGSLSHKLTFSMEDASEEAVAERMKWVQALSVFSDSIAPYWSALREAASQVQGITTLQMNPEGVNLDMSVGYTRTSKSFAFSEEGIAELVAFTRQLKTGNASSRETYEEALQLFAFARRADQKPYDLSHLPWEVSYSLADAGVREATKREDTERKLRAFHTTNILPHLANLMRAFELAGTGEIQIGLQLKDDGVHITRVIDVPASPDVKRCFQLNHDIAAIFPYTVEGVKMLLEHINTLKATLVEDVTAMPGLMTQLEGLYCARFDFKSLSGIPKMRVSKVFGVNHHFQKEEPLSVQTLRKTIQELEEAWREEKIKALERFVLYKYNVQRFRLGLPEAKLARTPEGTTVSVPNGFFGLLTLQSVNDLMRELRTFRKEHPGLETQVAQKRAGERGK